MFSRCTSGILKAGLRATGSSFETSKNNQWLIACDANMGPEDFEKEPLVSRVMQKVLESLVHERMSQGKEVKCTKEKKKVKGWSSEEMKGKPNSSLEEDTEELRTWRGMGQDEMDQCWKNLAERMEEKVLDSKREAYKGNCGQVQKYA